MKSLLYTLLLALSLNSFAQSNAKQALIIIDIQEFYFPGGFSELHAPEVAAEKAAIVLDKFRNDSALVIYVQHKVEQQMAISNIVKPLADEKIFVKSEVSCFNGTGLHDYLQELNISELVIVGMQTHMCVEAATRAGYDLGYKMSLIEDACTTKDLKWGNEIVAWNNVHLSTLATLKSYASIFTVDDWLKAQD